MSPLWANWTNYEPIEPILKGAKITKITRIVGAKYLLRGSAENNKKGTFITKTTDWIPNMTNNQENIIRKLQWVLLPIIAILAIEFFTKFYHYDPLGAAEQSN